ncbi:GIY-YIG nuclease family protein [Patescibacteria group bacterium]|nr:GIY-YIG nuclease family protein [Patescibacteria group bacterium]
MYIVYVISNPQDKIYVGQTDDFEQRLTNHNLGCFLGYTARMGGPWPVVYTEEYQSRSDALKREKYFKQGAGHRYLKEIIDKKYRGVA